MHPTLISGPDHVKDLQLRRRDSERNSPPSTCRQPSGLGGKAGYSRHECSAVAVLMLTGLGLAHFGGALVGRWSACRSASSLIPGRAHRA
jgi:hypothetical protein